MTEAEFIIADIRKGFDAWTRESGIKSPQAWLIWRAAILTDRKKVIAGLEPDAYQETQPKHWLRREISALKNSIKNNP